MRTAAPGAPVACALPLLLLAALALTAVHAFLPARAPQPQLLLERQLLARAAAVSPATLRSVFGQQPQLQWGRGDVRLQAAAEGEGADEVRRRR